MLLPVTDFERFLLRFDAILRWSCCYQHGFDINTFFALFYYYLSCLMLFAALFDYDYFAAYSPND